MQIALITGASRGFGLALADALLAEQWAVVIDARTAVDLESAAARLFDAHPGAAVRAIAGDIADESHRRALVAAAEGLGGIDLLVNNASLLGPSPQPSLADYPLQTFAEVHRVNVLAPLGLVQLALPALTRSGGTIVDISSDAAVEAYAGWGGYGSSKASLDHWTRILGVELPHLRVYSFDPGDMRTQMHQDAFPGEDISDRPLPEAVAPSLLALVRQRPPSGRYRASEVQLDEVGVTA